MDQGALPVAHGAWTAKRQLNAQNRGLFVNRCQMRTRTLAHQAQVL